MNNLYPIQENSVLKYCLLYTSLDLVDVGESIGFIEIPKIDVYLPIYSGTGEDVLQKGVGHLAESSYPIGGTSTHSVLTGHRGLPSAVLFTDLDKLEEGDVFYLHVLDEVLAYKVDQIKVVLPEETQDIGIVEGKDYCTLVTCTPYAINTHRLLVRGERTEYIPPEELAEQNAVHEVQSQTCLLYTSYSYTFTDDGTTQQTVLTVKDSKGNIYHFFWTDLDCNLLQVTDNNIANVTGDYGYGNKIYFDATYSKLNTPDSEKCRQNSIPASDDAKVYFYAWSTTRCV